MKEWIKRFNWLCEAYKFIIKFIPDVNHLLTIVLALIAGITTKINGTITICYWQIPAYTGGVIVIIILLQKSVNKFDNEKILISDVLDKAKDLISDFLAEPDDEDDEEGLYNYNLQITDLENKIVNELISGKIDLYGLDCKRNDGVLECISNEKVQYLKESSGKLHFKNSLFEKAKVGFDGRPYEWQNLYTKVSITKKDTSKLLNELKNWSIIYFSYI